MSTSVIALSIAAFLVINLIVGLGILSLVVGGITRYFGKPKFELLNTTNGDLGLAFAFTWNEAREPARYESIRLRLFNPFGSPTSVEVTQSFDASDESFARDLKMGPSFKTFIEAQNFENAKVEVELFSREGVSYIEEMSGAQFNEKLLKADKTVADFEDVAEIEEAQSFGPDVKAFGIVNRDTIADTVPGKGPVIAIPTNPAFEQFFGSPSAGGGGGAAAEAQENFNVSKVWIIEGCIVCNACEDIYPEVFEVIADGCIVKDGYPTDNGLLVQEAAEACPVEVIKFETA